MMKDSEHKIERTMPFEAVPGYLRDLANAIAQKTDNLPADLAGLPENIVKLKIEGKAKNGLWKLKIKIKSASSHLSPGAVTTGGPAEAINKAPSADLKSEYKALKKRMKAAFKDMGEALAAGKLPDSGLVNAFLEDTDRMMEFKGRSYGETHYPVFQEACHHLTQAHAANDREAFKLGLAALAKLKKECHQVFK